MSENTAPEEGRRKGSTEPGLEGEGGQYAEGDHGEAGDVGGTDRQAGADPEGDYGEAGAVGSAREVEVDEDREL